MGAVVVVKSRREGLVSYAKGSEVLAALESRSCGERKGRGTHDARKGGRRGKRA